ncbi:hypothetical protein MTO96_027363 [Rhipicephalus appendiculatus]
MGVYRISPSGGPKHRQQQEHQRGEFQATSGRREGKSRRPTGLRSRPKVSGSQRDTRVLPCLALLAQQGNAGCLECNSA